MIQNSASPLLTESQVEHFDTFGFLVRRKLFTADEIKTINNEFDTRYKAVLEETTKLEGKRVSNVNWPNRHPDSPFLTHLLEDPRIVEASEMLLGKGAVPILSNSNSYSQDTGWHPDYVDPNFQMHKNVIYLQATDAEKGALRLIPGSHKSPFHYQLTKIGLRGGSDDEAFLKRANLEICDIPAFVFSSQPGDMITFNGRIWHAAWGGYLDRRTCTFNFYKDPQSAVEKKSVQNYVEIMKTSRINNKTFGPQYHPSWVANNEKSSKREHWINWLREWGYLDTLNL